MRRTTLFASLLAIPILSMGPTPIEDVTLTGRVTDAVTGAPVSAVQVYLDGTSRAALSCPQLLHDSQGRSPWLR
jgi:hypothetical protein